MASRLLLVLFLALAALPATAQRPSPEAVLEAWAADWRRAADGVEAVEVDERLVSQIEGPRRPVEVVGTGRLVYGRGRRPRRTPEQLVVNGRSVDPERFAGHARRLDRAFGAAGREVGAPPPLPSALLARADAVALYDDWLSGQPVWRVELRHGSEQADAWFTRSLRSPRLLRLRTEGGRGDRARLVRDLQFVRVAGLDLPRESRLDVVARQRRRLRNYVVSVSAAGTYTGHRVVR